MTWKPQNKHRNTLGNENMPSWILEIRDIQGTMDVLDRYTILMYHPKYYPVVRGNMLSCLCTCTSGRGFSQWDELNGQGNRDFLGKRISWNSLSKELQKHIIMRAHPLYGTGSNK